MPQALRNVDKHTIVQVACGDDHFLALTSTGMVFACGNGEQSQLGRKIISRKSHPLSPSLSSLARTRARTCDTPKRKTGMASF